MTSIHFYKADSNKTFPIGNGYENSTSDITPPGYVVYKKRKAANSVSNSSKTDNKRK